MKIVFFDIDGTLYRAEEKAVHKEVSNTLRKLKERGVKIVVATGRSYIYVPECIRALKPDGFICSNGSYIVMQGKIWEEQYLDPDQVRSLIRYMDRDCFEYDMQTREKLYSKKNNLKLNTYQIYSEVPRERIQEEYNLEEIIEKIHKINIWVDHKKQLEKILRQTDGFAREIHLKTNHIELFASGPTKGAGVKKVLEIQGMDKEDAVCFGDSMNDYPMFQQVGTSVAMGNADYRLKEIADEITDTVENSGVAKFFQKKLKKDVDLVGGNW